MGAKFLSAEDADILRTEIEVKYKSVNAFGKATGISSPDLYSLLSGKKPMYPKWESIISKALDDNGRAENIVLTLYELCKRVEQISVELNTLYCNVKQACETGIIEREVNE